MANTINKVFKAQDGSDHKTEAAAVRHNELQDAKEAFEAAGTNVARKLGASALTADGQPFDMFRSRDYFRLVGEWNLSPGVQRVYIWPHNAHVEMDRPSGGRLCIRWWQLNDRWSGYVSIPIGDLYADELEAKKALAAAVKQTIAAMQERLTKLE